MMKNEEITVKVKKSTLKKLGIALGAVAALVLLFLAYSFFFDLNSAVADGMDREALVSVQNELSQNGYLTSLRQGSCVMYSDGEETFSTDEYYSVCVSVAQRKAASEYLKQKYTDNALDVDFFCYP